MIQYVVEEAVASGLSEIIIVTGRGKRAIEDHFDGSFELEYYLNDRGKVDELAQIKTISELASVSYVRQKEPLGPRHPIPCPPSSASGASGSGSTAWSRPGRSGAACTRSSTSSRSRGLTRRRRTSRSS